MGVRLRERVHTHELPLPDGPLVEPALRLHHPRAPIAESSGFVAGCTGVHAISIRKDRMRFLTQGGEFLGNARGYPEIENVHSFVGAKNSITVMVRRAQSASHESRN